MPFKEYPQPWRGGLLALTVLIFAVIILQVILDIGSWVLVVVVFGLIALLWWLMRYAPKQM